MWSVVASQAKFQSAKSRVFDYRSTRYAENTGCKRSFNPLRVASSITACTAARVTVSALLFQSAKSRVFDYRADLAAPVRPSIGGFNPLRVVSSITA